MHILAQQPYDEHRWDWPRQLVADTHHTDALGSTIQWTQDGDVRVDRCLEIGIGSTTYKRCKQEQWETLLIGRKNEEIECCCEDDKRQRHRLLITDSLDGESGRITENQERNEGGRDDEIRGSIRNTQRTLQYRHQQGINTQGKAQREKHDSNERQWNRKTFCWLHRLLF